MFRRIAAPWICLAILFSSFIITIEIAPTANANWIYVDDSGGADYSTIQEGIDAALPGYTVFVYAGTYYENVFVHTSINLIGEDMDTTIINGSQSDDTVVLWSEWINITGFTIEYSGTESGFSGIEVDATSNYCNISGNRIRNNYDGLEVFSEGNIISNNIISLNADDAIDVTNSSYNTIINNILTLNPGCGVYLFSSDNNNISSNFLQYGDWGVSLTNSHWNYIMNNNASHNEQSGIYLMNTSSIIIYDNDLYLNTVNGISMTLSSDTNISRNIICNNGDGIEIQSSDNVDVIDNIVVSNSQRGIGLYSSNNNNISINNVTFNTDHGITVWASSNNVVSENDVSRNGGLGIGASISSNNKIYHNNIIENDNQAQDDRSDNSWDDGYPSGGNYWSDYTGVDDNGDGIGDTPYEIDFNSYDNYPLIDPKTPPDEIPPVIISEPMAVFISDVSATIEWETDEVSDSAVEYGLTTNYGNEVVEYIYVTNHSIDLEGLNPSTLYHFRVRSKDSSGNEVVSGDYTFTMNPPSKPVHNMEKDTYYDTIQEAVDDVNSGNTIFVNNGTYYEDIVIDKTLTLTGENKEDTIINGSGSTDVIFITADWVNITGFSITGSGSNMSDAAIELHNVQNSDINNNNIFANIQGIDVNQSNYNVITANNISNNGIGIQFNCSMGNTFKTNVMVGDGIFITGASIEHWNSHDIDTSNTVNGKPVYYWKDRNSGTVPQSAGQVILANCKNVIIENQELINCTVGIELGFSQDIEIRDNTISQNILHGIFITSSHGNTINDNMISNNGLSVSLDYSDDNDIYRNDILEGAIGLMILASERNTITVNNISNNDNGIWLVSSKENVIEDNTISNIDYGIWVINANESILRANDITNHKYGIWLVLSDSCNISDNNISGNEIGIYIWINASYNIITNNTISSNVNGIMLIGMIMVHPENNVIYHNSFIDNTNQAVDSSSYGNQWDNGYPSGGNYWTDYSGVDFNNGPNQDISGSDGIGDSAYSIDSDSIDRYPLMAPWGEDAIAPSIELIAPFNNSIIKSGILINLSISDANLDEVRYSLDGSAFLTLLAPYDIDTTLWNDGGHTIEIEASDTFGNINSALFGFEIDSVIPTIEIISPENGSVINSDAEIQLSILDDNLDDVFYSLNEGSWISFYAPYSLSADAWPEGTNTISIQANDEAANIAEKMFIFTKDSIPPEITLSTPVNGSILSGYKTLVFDITDANLDSVSYSIDQGAFSSLSEPYNIETSSWEEGNNVVTLRASDLAGNSNERWFEFTIDTVPPSIISCSVANHAVDVVVDTEIILEFDESMDTQSVESAFSITQDLDYSCWWSNEDTILTIEFPDSLDYETVYQISIDNSAKDLGGNELEEEFTLEFTTEAKPKDKGEEGIPFIYLLLALIAAIVAVLLVVFMVLSKKRKPAAEVVETEIESPVPIQVKCPRCNNLLSVNDIGTTMNVSCPFCATLLTVQSQKTPVLKPEPQIQPQPETQPEIQSQQPMMQISCPKCSHIFSVIKSEGPIKVQCPNCGAQGTFR